MTSTGAERQGVPVSYPGLDQQEDRGAHGRRPRVQVLVLTIRPKKLVIYILKKGKKEFPDTPTPSPPRTCGAPRFPSAHIAVAVGWYTGWVG